MKTSNKRIAELENRIGSYVDTVTELESSLAEANEQAKTLETKLAMKSFQKEVAPTHQRIYELEAELTYQKEINKKDLEKLSEAINLGVRQAKEYDAEILREKEINRRLVEGLTSISKNSCCGQCQEAKLVAEKALAESLEG